MSKTVSIAAFEALQAQGMKKGSKVKIMSSWPGHSEGFNAYWASDMDRTVGKTGIVVAITSHGDHYRIQVSVTGESTWWYPTMVLHLVDSEPKDTLQVNDSLSLRDFDKDLRTVSAVLGDSFKTITYDEIKALYAAINKSTVEIAGYDASIDYVKESVKIGCQSVSFEAIKKAYKLTRSSKSVTAEESKREFRVGDMVEYYRRPTEGEWEKIGQVDIPFQIGDVLRIKTISDRTKSLSFDGSIYGFPHQAFRPA